jgi:hypothetical protein
LVLGYVQEFSHQSHMLRAWLNHFIKPNNGDIRLIVADYTDYEIPWEMLKLDIEGETYLGAAINVSRWQAIISHDKLLPIDFNEQVCGGVTLAYVNDTELAGAEPELEALDSIGAKVYRDIGPFLAELKSADERIGLIFMACHGGFGDDGLEGFTLGSLSNRSQQVSLVTLRGSLLAAIGASRPVAFLNACHAGRLSASVKRLPGTYRRGFPELFIGKGAVGVIGPVGNIGDTDAGLIAGDLITRLVRSPAAPVAHTVRAMRADAAAAHATTGTAETQLRLIFSFMYVYYGVPHAILELAAEGAEK